MKHFGDITKLSGYNLPVVDVITGGSPCQDLSVAGKRAGLDGERSGLFMEQVRITKEMREHDRSNGRTGDLARPRYLVWENVPGAFSSNGGKDFQAVLTEIAKIAEPECPDIPLPKNGKWSKSGALFGVGADGCPFSIAWRVHDAQFWGVPQRRKRISLVADFGGLSAPEILFERKGLSRDFEPCGEARQETAGAVGGGVEGAGGCLTGWDVQSKRIFNPDGKSGTLNSGTTEGMNIVPSVLQSVGVDTYNQVLTGNIACSLTAIGAGDPTKSGPSVLAYGIDQQGGKGGANYTEDVCPPILSDSHGTPHAVAYGISSYDSNAMKSPNPHSGIYEADTARTLDLNGGSPACNQGGIAVVQPSYCLQGNGIGRSDNAGCNGKGWTEEVSYTLNTIDRPAVVQSVGCDVYNQEVTGEVAASLTAASGGTNTSGPKVLSCGFKPRQGAAARSLGFEREKSPTINTDENYAVLCLNDQGGSVMGVSEDVTGALRAEEHGHQPIVYNGENITSPLNKADPQPGDPCHTLGTDSRNYLVYENHSQDSRYKPLGEVSETVSAKYGTGGNNQPLVVSGTYQTVTGALTPGAHPGSYNGQDAYNDMLIAQTISCGNPWDPQSERVFHGDGAWHSLAGNNGGGQSRDAVMVFDKEMYNCGKNCTGTPQAREDTVAPTCRADAHPSGVAYNAIVRRLTPLECERLQGYPDGWTNIGEWVDSKGKKHKDADSPRYKALGNSIALPFWQWMARRICAQYERPVTMASLFDGIGGFPLVFQRCGATPVWASEIEEFPIAVTKVRFPEEE